MAEYCGFCGKHEKDVGRLIEGPTVAVCDECIQLMHGMLAKPAEPGFKSFDEFRLKMRRPRT